jgi:hypothetical protein
MYTFSKDKISIKQDLSIRGGKPYKFSTSVLKWVTGKLHAAVVFFPGKAHSVPAR